MKKLKPAALLLYLPNGQTEAVLHFKTGDAIAINNEPPADILGYAHTPEGTHVYLPGTMPKIYRVHNEYEAGESREYFLKRLPDTITELCVQQVQKEIVFHPAPIMTVSWVNPERELPIHGEFKKAA